MSIRILSLVPSITLTLFDLGLEKWIVGRTKFCIHPSGKIKEIPVIGGTKNIDIATIRLLKPDLIIANKEENEKDQILLLKKEFDVWVTNIQSIEDNYRFLAALGKKTGTEEKAAILIQDIRKAYDALEDFKTGYPLNPVNVLYLIWRKPYMTVGRDTFIHAQLAAMGLHNMFTHQTRYPIIQQFNTSYFKQCQVVFLSSEPYPFTEKHLSEIKTLLPNAQIMLVNGEYFSWYGSRILETPAYLQGLMKQMHELLGNINVN